MAVKLTKNEQKKQKDQLKQFTRYLPTLQLKKQQLQMVIRDIESKVVALKVEQQKLVDGMQDWICVYAENKVFAKDKQLSNLVKIDRVVRVKSNIAGVTIPEFKELTFQEIDYDLNEYPLWVDDGISTLREYARLDALISTLDIQMDLLGKELRTTSQRVNLFEKVKIPEAKKNIKRISIYLGDQQAAAVVRGKIAKTKAMGAQV
ncbi:MAG: V-type ATP synthase subunit D [Sphaerochaetaceae bacterium]|jgi:V/A-type H+-transporting ATPase subunit D|nr:V-type ATP synthase subunit D [Sphaerochaetaceae bacterium]